MSADASAAAANSGSEPHGETSDLWDQLRERLSPLLAKAEKKGRTKADVDQVIYWLTGYDESGLQEQLTKRTDLETFFAQAPAMNPSRALIKGVICGIRVEDIEDPLMRDIRYMDKLVDEVARGKAMDKILRKS